jgi:hypothetical protein
MLLAYIIKNSRLKINWKMKVFLILNPNISHPASILSKKLFGDNILIFVYRLMRTENRTGKHERKEFIWENYRANLLLNKNPDLCF